MKSWVNRIIIVLCAIAMCMAVGCGRFVKPYGMAAPDTKNVRYDGKPLFIPGNAPSISQGYKPPPENKDFPAHEGIDIFGKKGTPVIASAEGVVIISYFEPFAGHRVIIDHGRNEDGLIIRSGYYHLEKRLVKQGDHVTRGQQIGTLGSTGLLATFPHLHFEIRVGARPDQTPFKPVNPHLFWANGIGIVTCFNIARQWPDAPFKITYPVPCRGID